MKRKWIWGLGFLLGLFVGSSSVEAGTLNQEIARAQRENEAFFHAQKARMEREVAAVKAQIDGEIEANNRRIQSEMQAFATRESQRSVEELKREVERIRAGVQEKRSTLNARVRQLNTFVEAHNQEILKRRQTLEKKKTGFFTAPDSVLASFTQEAQERLERRVREHQEATASEVAQTQELAQDLLLHRDVFPQLRPALEEESKKLTNELIEKSRR